MPRAIGLHAVGDGMARVLESSVSLVSLLRSPRPAWAPAADKAARALFFVRCGLKAGDGCRRHNSSCPGLLLTRLTDGLSSHAVVRASVQVLTQQVRALC